MDLLLGVLTRRVRQHQPRPFDYLLPVELEPVFLLFWAVPLDIGLVEHQVLLPLSLPHTFAHLVIQLLLGHSFDPGSRSQLLLAFDAFLNAINGVVEHVALFGLAGVGPYGLFAFLELDVTLGAFLELSPSFRVDAVFGF